LTGGNERHIKKIRGERERQREGQRDRYQSVCPGSADTAMAIEREAAPDPDLPTHRTQAVSAEFCPPQRSETELRLATSYCDVRDARK